MKICLNADVGESFGRYRIGNDELLLPSITSANIACGMHAGDPTIMVRTIEMASNCDTSIGAHPGFNDIWGFGRRQIRMAPKDIEYLVTYQIGALQALAGANGEEVRHVKPHGALNNIAHDDIEVAQAVASGIKAADPDLVFIANFGSCMSEAGMRAGLKVANEGYADRTYDDNGKMLSRELENSVLRDPRECAAHVLKMVQNQEIHTVGGRRIPARIDTFCVHGDEPYAAEIARQVREALEAEGVDLVPIAEIF